ncbi:CocE/NonD family hydrolase [Bacillus sp. ISL-37]|uniref:CocE/NonD family hydrolase n=1 Tax=Bacillus sp. ISL-37 TaxID=2819123 RepID=UPI001BE7D259|nr:CocE/NonD family hydrolase [Bacillus sp. ISL-37]MBT2686025.1 CocE/NonD family hydrolase [Bacillus sp. ISL-37]
MEQNTVAPNYVIKDGMIIEWDVPIEMEDGIILRADVYRPIAEGEYPVVLTYGPYAKGLAFQEAYPRQWNVMTSEHPDVEAGSTNKYQTWEAVDPEKWVPHDYVCVRVDSRGAGRSPGYLSPFSKRETQDYYNCIEWAGVQPWSNGKVGLLGISYYAMNQWQVAALQPPHLAAMIPWEGSSDWYRDATHHGGIVSTFWETWLPQILTVQHGVGERGKVNPNNGVSVAGPDTLPESELEKNRTNLGWDIVSHPLANDEYYKERQVDWSKVTVPLLSAANWGGIGLHSRGNFEGFKRAASTQKWLEVHGLEHWTHFYTDYGVQLQQRFFDHFLKGEDNGWDQEPPVLLNVRKVNDFTERKEQDWPLPRTEWKKLYLDLNNKGFTSEPSADRATIAYKPLEEEVTLITEPHEKEVELTGPMAAKLFVSSATVDADLFLTVRVFDPSGNEIVYSGAMDPRTPISQGWLRASHRKLDPAESTFYQPYHSHDEIQPLTPDEVYELDIEIWPTSIVIPEGYRLGLTIGGKDYRNCTDEEGVKFHTKFMTGSGAYWHDDVRDRPEEIFGGKVNIHAGEGRNGYLLVPVIPEK